MDDVTLVAVLELADEGYTALLRRLHGGRDEARRGSRTARASDGVSPDPSNFFNGDRIGFPVDRDIPEFLAFLDHNCALIVFESKQNIGAHVERTAQACQVFNPEIAPLAILNFPEIDRMDTRLACEIGATQPALLTRRNQPGGKRVLLVIFRELQHALSPINNARSSRYRPTICAMQSQLQTIPQG
jgi:hypothetical protein